MVHCFCRAMRCISPAYAVMRCLSVCLSVCLSRSWVASKRIKISSKFFSPLGSHNRILCTSKSEAAVTGNKKPRCRYVKADYRQTRSIARSLCDSSASCYLSVRWVEKCEIALGYRPICPQNRLLLYMLSRQVGRQAVDIYVRTERPAACPGRSPGTKLMTELSRTVDPSRASSRAIVSSPWHLAATMTRAYK